jgi:WD40 repeat protein
VTGDNPPLYWQGLYGNGNPITPDAPATGTFLAYSTCIGNKAPDFKVKDNNHAQSPNSPYTTVLLKLMRIPNFTIEQTFDSLKYQVDTLPAYETEMIGRFCFNPKLISNRDKKDTVIQHHFNTVRTIAFSSDATRMITGGWDNRLLCYDVSNQRVLYEVANGPYDDKITSVAMSPDNQYFAVSSTDSTIKLYRLSDGDWIHTWKDAQGMMMTVHFSPDGKYLAAGGHDMQVYVYRIRDKQLVYALGQHTDRVHQVRFSPNGQYLATASLDKTVLLYPTSNFDAPQLLSEYEAGMNVVSFSPNGRYLAVGGIDKKVHLYQVWNKRLLHTFENHTENIYSVCFSPDNKFMASAGEDGKVHIYELTNYSLVETLSDHGDWVYQVCFSPKGQLLVTASKDRTLRLYRKH